MPTRSTRSNAIDTLRGIAVFGILAVNVWSFIWGFEPLRYGVLPAFSSWSDRAAVFLVAFLAEQKFYPVFAFLFGAGFALHTRSLRRRLPDWIAVRRTYGRRMRWLLLCGILHGTLIWFGDILTVYAVAGFLILNLAGAPLRRVQANLRNWTIVWLLLAAFNFYALLPHEPGAAHDVDSMLALVYEARSIYTEGSVFEIAWLRLSDYVSVTTQSLLLLPHVIMLFLLGTIAVRRGWLTRPQRHRTLWRRVRMVGLGLGIPLNLVWAYAATREAIDPYAGADFALGIYALLPLAGTLMAAGYVGHIMLRADRQPRLERWMAPVGRMALTNYLSQSVLGTMLFQATGLALGAQVSHAQTLLIAGGIPLLQLFWSRWWLKRNAQGPMEVLYRRSERGAIK